MEKTENIGHQSKVIDKVSLNSAIWEVPLSKWNVSLANRYYLAQQRQGTKKTKNKGEVSGGGIKPWRQKGTGRARSGSIRNPHFRGGGVAFGPTGKENYSLDINKKFKKKVLQSLLGEKMRQQGVIVLDKITFDDYKVKEAEKLLINLLFKDLKPQIEKLKQEVKDLKVIQKKTVDQEEQLAEKERELIKLKKKMKQKTKTLLILAHEEENKEKIIRSFRNLPYVNISDSKSVNSQQVLSPNYLIFTQSAFSEIEKRLS